MTEAFMEGHRPSKNHGKPYNATSSLQDYNNSSSRRSSSCFVLFLMIIMVVTQPLYESHMIWVHDPAPPASRCPIVDFDDTRASAITSVSPGAPLAPPDPRQDSTATLTRENISGSGFSITFSAATLHQTLLWTAF